MKYLDRVKIINLREKYKEDNISLGDIGVIWEPEIKNCEFYVMFENESNSKNLYRYSTIKIEDLQMVEDGGCTDDLLLNDLPNHNKRLWCKVIDGYIVNLNGDKKNKIAYKFNT